MTSAYLTTLLVTASILEMSFGVLMGLGAPMGLGEMGRGHPTRSSCTCRSGGNGSGTGVPTTGIRPGGTLTERPSPTRPHNEKLRELCVSGILSSKMCEWIGERGSSIIGRPAPVTPTPPTGEFGHTGPPTDNLRRSTGEAGIPSPGQLLHIQSDDEDHEYRQAVMGLVAEFISNLIELDKIREKLNKWNKEEEENEGKEREKEREENEGEEGEGEEGEEHEGEENKGEENEGEEREEEREENEGEESEGEEGEEHKQEENEGEEREREENEGEENEDEEHEENGEGTESVLQRLLVIFQDILEG